jgi:hypothetical protein
MSPTSRLHDASPPVPVCTVRPQRPHLAPLYVNEGLFPPVDGAPVLVVVKQSALDDGCGPALL